jgi:hypothetical protein
MQIPGASPNVLFVASGCIVTSSSEVPHLFEVSLIKKIKLLYYNKDVTDVNRERCEHREMLSITHTIWMQYDWIRCANSVLGVIRKKVLSILLIGFMHTYIRAPECCSE